MLRQDPFENLISFICSSNNNISRITKMVKSLCQHYSPPLLTLAPPATSSGEPTSEEHSATDSYHPFPPPSVLASSEVSAKLRSLGFGYRADFIQKTAKMLVEAHGTTKAVEDSLEPSERWLLTLRRMSTCDAREELLKFMGVGRKVADCILLMSLDKNEVIPVDTHVHQIAVKHYGLRVLAKGKANMTPKLYEEVSTKLAAVWGDYAGWAHSVLFTSDLRSFSSHGLPSPSPTPSVAGSPQKTAGAGSVSDTARPSPTKRKRVKVVQLVNKGSGTIIDHQLNLPTAVGSEMDDDHILSLADRVKRRRRTKMVEVTLMQ
ncbi:N-glycosylase/DNA lyase [Sparassis crispa]|uniref:DNA-(apurinic or apyrimidinic site) lyase n=1 Tax=Sparassis crispa TaxID=139825 RepID=A0A401GJ05_9APHY|nr:N-glycosylase/DNA lyase [Sparassis crispa]GBE82091.1 N-glycosylase/DNA lyase [Sparassis crispa]